MSNIKKTRNNINNLACPIQVICCGLSTVDVQLHACQVPVHLEHITPFSHTTTTAGGSAPQTSISLSALCVPTAVFTAVGEDDYANVLQTILNSHGVNTQGLILDNTSPTAVAMLPLFTDGRRGCFVTLGANLKLTPHKILQQFLSSSIFSCQTLRAFHFGYPHLMPHFQYQGLHTLCQGVYEKCPNAIITLDVNGAGDNKPVLQSNALQFIAHVHANLEEACAITGLYNPSDTLNLRYKDIISILNWFLDMGVASISITCGRDGAFFATAKTTQKLKHARVPQLPENVIEHRSAFETQLKDGGTVNASGAGDAFIAGVIAQLVETSSIDKSNCDPVDIHTVIDAGLASALRRIDDSLLSGKQASISEVIEQALKRGRLPTRHNLLLLRDNQLSAI